MSDVADDDVLRAERDFAAGDLNGALQACHIALTANPRCAPAHMIIGRIMRAAGETTVAIHHMAEAATLAPESAAFALEFSELLIAHGRTADAGKAIARAIAAAPDAAAPAAASVDLIARTADPSDAAAAADRLMARFPGHIGAIRTAAIAYSAVDRHDDAIKPLERVLANPDLAANLRGPLLFVLARVRERAGDHEGAWEAACAANAIRGLRLDAAAHQRRVDRIIEFFGRSEPEGPPAASAAARPIFIVGMPRSGTTLVEQILTSHPDVDGAGELGLLERIENRLESDLPFPHSLASVTPEGWHAIAEFANGELAQRAGAGGVVTEKSVTNALYLGLLARIRPDARIVFCERDPLDTCLSCFFIDFSAYLPYAYDLTDLGTYHATFDRLATHWREVLSLPWTTVRYEDIVADQERTTRELLEFCGLEFDERCLRFHENERPVLTASAEQVRRPLYSTSVGRHKKYETHLAPLKRALAHNTRAV